MLKCETLDRKRRENDNDLRGMHDRSDTLIILLDYYAEAPGTILKRIN